MVSQELKEIIEKLNEQGKMAFLDPVTEEQIRKFEEEEGIELPEKYKEWLCFSDTMACVFFCVSPRENL